VKTTKTIFSLLGPVFIALTVPVQMTALDKDGLVSKYKISSSWS
jgi:hypothetical protein